jgi:mannose-6-phosphate isomerase
MGTHPWLPSRGFATGQPLREILEKNPVLLTEAISKKFGNNLPFLFKIISIEKALCIQAHPDGELARQLHARDSAAYPGKNA